MCDSKEVKKAYVELVDLMNSMPAKTTVKQLLANKDFEALVMPKSAPKAFRTDENGNTTEVYCYYHKEWEDVTTHEYSKKASSASGLNSMCKVGTNQWTKQQSVARKAQTELIDLVSKGLTKPEELKDLMAEIEAKRVKIVALPAN